MGTDLFSSFSSNQIYHTGQGSLSRGTDEQEAGSKGSEHLISI